MKFTHEANKSYSLDMVVLTGDFRTGLDGFLCRTGVQAVFLGTRRGDPNAPGQETFSPSSPGWPPFMRVNPIIDWSYHDVWCFLRMAGLPYCVLYDRGYTSLGSVKTTRPNEALAREDGTFAPAHALPDARLERAGRLQSVCRMSSLPQDSDTRTVGLLVVGDEILANKVEDVNMKFLCGELRAAGWRVEQAIFVQDNVQAISSAVQKLSDEHDAVISAGGLGPTIDDVTMAGMAAAFGHRLERNADLERRIRKFFGNDTTQAHLKMAEAPSTSELVLIDYNDSNGAISPFPVVRVRNVYVLPGVPTLVQTKWPAVRNDLLTRCAFAPSPFQSIILRLRLRDETVIAGALEEVAEASGPKVAIGSYPVASQSDGCEVVLSLESKDSDALQTARDRLMDLLPPGSLASEHKNQDAAVNSPAEAPTVGIES